MGPQEVQRGGRPAFPESDCLTSPWRGRQAGAIEQASKSDQQTEPPGERKHEPTLNRPGVVSSEEAKLIREVIRLDVDLGCIASLRLSAESRYVSSGSGGRQTAAFLPPAFKV